MTTLGRALLILVALSVGIHAVNAGSTEILAHGGTEPGQERFDPTDGFAVSTVAHACHVSIHAAAHGPSQIGLPGAGEAFPCRAARRPETFQAPPATPPPTI